MHFSSFIKIPTVQRIFTPKNLGTLSPSPPFLARFRPMSKSALYVPPPFFSQKKCSRRGGGLSMKLTYSFWETYIGLSIYRAIFCLFGTMKMFYPPKGSAKQNLMGSIWQSFHFILLEKRFWHFQIPDPPSAFLKSWNCFIHRRDYAKADFVWGPFDSLSILFGQGKGFWTFRFRGRNPPFWNLENVLSPEGTATAEPKVVHLTVFAFYFVWETVMTLSQSPFSIGLF